MKVKQKTVVKISLKQIEINCIYDACCYIRVNAAHRFNDKQRKAFDDLISGLEILYKSQPEK